MSHQPILSDNLEEYSETLSCEFCGRRNQLAKEEDRVICKTCSEWLDNDEPGSVFERRRNVTE